MKSRQVFEDARASRRLSNAAGEDLQVLQAESFVTSQEGTDASSFASLLRPVASAPASIDETGRPCSSSNSAGRIVESPPDFGQARFAQLPLSLRAKVQNIQGCEELRNAWRFSYAIRWQNFALHPLADLGSDKTGVL